MPSAFATQFVKRAKNFDFSKKRKHSAGKSFGKVDCPDGSYTTLVTLEASVPTKGSMEGVPIVRAVAEISAGQYQGLAPSKSFFCKGEPAETDPDQRPTAEQELLALLEFLLPDIQIDDMSQVPQAIDEVNNRIPLVLTNIKTNKGTDDKEYQNLYFNKVVKEATVDCSTDDSTPSAKAEDPTPDAEYAPAKGDMVYDTSKDDGTEYEVKQVSQARQTANLEDADGNKVNGVKWTDLALV